MTFLRAIFDRLEGQADTILVREVHNGKFSSATGAELARLVGQGRRFVASLRLKIGDRCALLAPNSIRWIALDFALMAEGIIVVPLYPRQSPAELAAMIKDSSSVAVFGPDESFAAELRKNLPAAPRILSIDKVFAGEAVSGWPAYSHADADPVTIMYTSGTSGEPKGVVLNAGNINHTLSSTNRRLDVLMDGSSGPDRIFHYTPFCFAASWIALLTFLSRESVLTLSTDLTKLSDELKISSPDYFLNVPTLLERVRAKVTDTIRERGGLSATIFNRAQRAFLNRRQGKPALSDGICLRLAGLALFPKIRKNIGPNLKALICGSAPLAIETQLFFTMLGVPVLQVYGLTETTAICTMDDPRDFEPGKVGAAIPGIEMKLGENDEILVRGPNIFPGYWRRPAETAKALEGGWFHTGDQGEVDPNGKWKITGRLKNLVVLNSGHKIAPEPIEQALAGRLPEAEQIVLLGNQRSYATVLLTTAARDGLQNERVQSAVDAMNATLPHYKQLRAFWVVREPFSIENGLLTTNGKIKRDAVARRFSAEIERLYERQHA